jgi:hypothetical protein
VWRTCSTPVQHLRKRLGKSIWSCRTPGQHLAHTWATPAQQVWDTRETPETTEGYVDLSFSIVFFLLLFLKL